MTLSGYTRHPLQSGATTQILEYFTGVYYLPGQDWHQPKRASKKQLLKPTTRVTVSLCIKNI